MFSKSMPRKISFHSISFQVQYALNNRVNQPKKSHDEIEIYISKGEMVRNASVYRKNITLFREYIVDAFIEQNSKTSGSSSCRTGTRCTGVSFINTKLISFELKE